MTEPTQTAGARPAATAGSGGAAEAYPSAWRQLLTAIRHGEGSLARHLLTAGTGTAGLHIVAALLALVTSVIVARTLGAEAYGAFVFAIAMLHLLSVPGVLGLNELVVREVSACLVSGQHATAAGLLRRSDQLVLAASVTIAALAAVGAWVLRDQGGDRRMLEAVWIALLAVPLLSLTKVRQAALQGLHRIIHGQIPETVAWPLLFLALLGGYLLVVGRPPSAQAAVALQVIGVAGALALAAALLQRHLPSAVKAAVPEYRTRQWLISALPLVSVAGLHIINSRTDTLMLAALKGSEAVGVYNVASRGAGFVGFLLMAGQRAMAPTIARLYRSGERQRLQEVVTTTTRLITAASVPLAIAFIFQGERILTFVYGAEYAGASTALAILSVGYLLGVAMGPTAPLLVMTGHERLAAAGVGLSAVVNIVLNAALIPHFGLEGAAIATGASVITWNTVFVLVIRRRLNIHPTAFARLERADPVVREPQP